MRTLIIFGMGIVLAVPLVSQIKEKDKFPIRIIEIKKAGRGCTISATSERVRYELTSEIPAPCAMIEAGEEYKAYRAVSQSRDDEKEDSAILIIFDNTDNQRRSNSVYDIVSEEAVQQKAQSK
jgi:hypothetical protein